MAIDCPKKGCNNQYGYGSHSLQATSVRYKEDGRSKNKKVGYYCPGCKTLYATEDCVEAVAFAKIKNGDWSQSIEETQRMKKTKKITKKETKKK